MSRLFLCVSILVPARLRQRPSSRAAAPAGPPSQVTFYGSPQAAIASGVVIPADRAFVWTSGTTPSVAKTDAPGGFA